VESAWAWLSSFWLIHQVPSLSSDDDDDFDLDDWRTEVLMD